LGLVGKTYTADSVFREVVSTGDISGLEDVVCRCGRCSRYDGDYSQKGEKLGAEVDHCNCRKLFALEMLDVEVVM
jgi:hypothetical protein